MPSIKPIGPNQTELHMANGDVILFSYKTAVAASTVNGWYRTRTHYSKTTSRHINKWIGTKLHTFVDQIFIDALVK